MVEVDVKTKDDGFIDIKVSGHGDSRVCAAVSALLQSSVRYMEDLEQEYPGQIIVNVKEDGHD